MNFTALTWGQLFTIVYCVAVFFFPLKAEKNGAAASNVTGHAYDAVSS